MDSERIDKAYGADLSSGQNAENSWKEGVMAKTYFVALMTLTGGWDEFTVTNENLLLIQARTAVDIQVNFEVGNRTLFYTVKAGEQLPLSSQNGRDDVVHIKATAGVVVEILRQFEN